MRRFFGIACLMGATAAVTIVTLALTGFLPATPAGAAPKLDCDMLQLVHVNGTDLPDYPPQPSTQPFAVIAREVLDAEAKRVYPREPEGASQLWPAIEAADNPAISRNGDIIYVSLINRMTGRTTAGLVFTDRASGLVLESLAYCADIRPWPLTPPSISGDQ